MAVEVIGIDHVYVTVRDMERSEKFYDRVMAVLGFRKSKGTIGGAPHLFYQNRHFVYSLRPAGEGTTDHDPYAPGLHHFCLRVVDEAAVDRAARELGEAGVEATEPRYYPEYAPDYYATFFEDPDGVRLEVMNFREVRRKVMYDWEERANLQGFPHSARSQPSESTPESSSSLPQPSERKDESFLRFKYFPNAARTSSACGRFSARAASLRACCRASGKYTVVFFIRLPYIVRHADALRRGC